MKKVTYINASNLPPFLPITGTLVWWLFLDRLNVPSWMWGVFWTLVILTWIMTLVMIFASDRINVVEKLN